VNAFRSIAARALAIQARACLLGSYVASILTRVRIWGVDTRACNETSVRVWGMKRAYVSYGALKRVHVLKQVCVSAHTLRIVPAEALKRVQACKQGAHGQENTCMTARHVHTHGQDTIQGQGARTSVPATFF
jgi:hypothetical protein